MKLLRVLLISILLLTNRPLHSQDLFFTMLADSAHTLIKDHVEYDPSYFAIAYPNGDVPGDKGVCTDVVIRAYRKMGIDLQKEVHVDMKQFFKEYPDIWGLTSTDRNIDHRRVPNLMKFFERYGEKLVISQNSADYLPGDIVCWDLGGGITHIGIVINKKSSNQTRYLIVHNIGAGQVAEDMLFRFKIIGHFRYKYELIPY